MDQFLSHALPVGREREVTCDIVIENDILREYLVD